MWKKIILLLAVVWVCSAHDLFIKMDSYFIKPSAPAKFALFNGTFTTSENTISRDRIRDIQLFGHHYYQKPDTGAWYDKGNSSYLRFSTGAAGTYLATMSIYPRMIELSAKDFNAYLEHDGVVDILEYRTRNNQLGRSAKERYAKHVKAVFQVGDKRTGHFNKVTGYPVEFIPLKNPYEAVFNGYLEFQLLKHSKPLPGQWVYAGYDDGHRHGAAEGQHSHNEVALKTDSEGKFKIKLNRYGKWYVRTIHMVPAQEPGLDYISHWATLTFEIGRK